MSADGFRVDELQLEIYAAKEQLGACGESIFAEILSDRGYRNIVFTREFDKYHPFDIRALGPDDIPYVFFDVCVGSGLPSPHRGGKLAGTVLNINEVSAGRKLRFIENECHERKQSRFFIGAIFYGINGGRVRIYELTNRFLRDKMRSRDLESEGDLWRIEPGPVMRLRTIAKRIAEAHNEFDQIMNSSQVQMDFLPSCEK